MPLELNPSPPPNVSRDPRNSVLNHLPGTILVNASLSARLQSPNSRVDLNDMRTERGASVARKNPTPTLHPTENLDMIVEHALEDLGTHTLRVRFPSALPHTHPI